jgi:hypothetical protein
VELTVTVLAALRLARLAADDTITAPLRDRLASSTRPAAGWLLDMLACPWCVTVWSSAAATLLVRRARPAAIVLAAAEAAGRARAAGADPPHG